MILRAIPFGLALVALAVPSAAQGLGSASPQPVGAFRGFIENQGQWDTDARFVAEFGDLLVRAEPGAIVVQRDALIDGQSRRGVVRLAFESPRVALPEGGERAPGEFHYFLGNDPARWRRHVPAYSDIVYPDVAPGVTVRLYSRDGHLEYDVLVSASADVDDFVVRCEEINGLAIEANGELRIDTPLGPILRSAPVARQVTPAGDLVAATCKFRVLDQQRFGLTVSDRVPGASLLVDPGLTWATFLGGAAADYADKVRVLADGRLLIVGRSRSVDFPTTPGVFDTTCADLDVTVTCMPPSGDAVIFSTFLGGADFDLAASVDLSQTESIGVAGFTESTDFPTQQDSYDATYNGGGSDAFVAILSPDGSDLDFSTLIGGACGDSFSGVGFLSSGLIVAAGGTCSANFPVTPSALDGAYSAMTDGVVCWFDPSQAGQAQLVYSSFLGSSGDDQIRGLRMGPGDQPIIVGTTGSADFPTTPGAYDETPGGSFITRLAADGTSLVASTHFKGGDPWRVALDGQTILIAGNPDFDLPVSPDAYDTTWNGQSDCFVARFDGQLTRVLAATYVGGSRNEFPSGLVVDPSGDIVIAGRTQSDNYPTTPGAYDTVKGGPLDSTTSMVSRLSSDLSQLRYSSFLGPAMAASSWANDVAALGSADVVVVGEGAQTGFPVTPGAYDETFNGGTLGGADGYVARMLLKPLTWYSLGGAVAGSNGTPALAGSGELIGGQPVTLALTNGKPGTPSTLIVGLSLLNAPFKGGTLVPNPNLMLFGLPTNGHGVLTLNATWPSGLPSGFSFYTQYWIPDAAAPAGLAASNGLAGTTP